MTHTPGPWTIELSPQPADIIGKCDGWIVGSGGKYIAPMSGKEGANARLIAAAPDIFSALKEIVAEIKKFHPTFDARLFVQAERAIAKAEGK